MCRKLICLVFSILVVGMTSSGYADLVGHWMLDEGSGTTVSDSSGNGNDGTFVNNPTWIAGVYGGALEFHGLGVVGGVADYINCGNDASLHFTGPFTIALWIRPDVDDPEGKGLAGGETAPMAKAMDPGWSWQVRYGWGTTDPSMGFQFNATPRTWVYVGQNLERYEWCHIAASYDGTTVKCYLNGVETDSAAMSALVGLDSPLLIGSDGWGCDWIGAIDDVRLYDHALSEPEIGTLTSLVIASNPSPSDGAIHPQIWATLEWQPGAFAASHDVYMGDNFDDVNDGVNETFRGNQKLNSLLFVAGFTGYAFPDGLVPGTTY
ncbi:MAG TPA: LamG domain-containing protein, partial [Sedimentisphaerales bacterium]|nr:LamG domain-containing protein [Sedimentisphaerales bacterium]